MSRVVRTALLCVAMFLVSPIAGATQDVSYLDEAVQALQTHHLYISPLANVDSATKEELETQAQGSSIAVVALPAEAVNEADGSSATFVAEVAERTGYDTIVIAFGNDLEAGSSKLQAGTASQLANQAEAESSSAGDALLEFVAEVKAVPPTDHTDDSGVGPVISILLGFAAIVVSAITLYRSRRRRRVKSAASPQPTPQDELLASLESMCHLASRITDVRLDDDIRAAADQTKVLLNEIENVQQPDLLDSKTQELLINVAWLQEVLEMYLKAQNSYHGFSSREEADKVMAETKEVITIYGDYVRRNLGIVGARDMVKFRVNVEMLSKLKLDPN